MIGSAIALIFGVILGLGLAYLYKRYEASALDAIRADFDLIHTRISRVETTAQAAAAKVDAVAAEAKSIVSKAETVTADPLPVIK